MTKPKHHLYSSLFAILVVSALLFSLGVQLPVSPRSVGVPPAGTQAPPTRAYQPRSEPAQVRSSSEPIPARIVIRFAANASPAERAAYVESLHGTVAGSIDSLDTVILTVPDDVTQADLPESPVVEQSEPDYFVSALDDASPVNDPRYAEQWALPAIGAPQAWAQMPAGTASVTVAVIDSGICASHPDLAGRLVDGWDFLEGDALPQDDFGHGCSVSGLIAANLNDGLGIAGVAPNAQIMPLRVLNANGVGSYSDVAAAIVYAADHGAQVINLSLGGSNPSATLENAIDYAIAQGLIVVAAAGNNGTEGALYPAAYPNVIAVGSIDPNLQHSSFSNYGAQVDIWAPGRDILTTGPDGGYALVSGTSFAAPYVAGAQALSISAGQPLTLDGSVLSLGVPFTPTNTPAIPSPVPGSDIPTPETTETPVAITISGHVLSNGQFVYGPNMGEFNLNDYLEQKAPHLSQYAVDLYGRAEFYSINPKIYLTLLELDAQLLTQPDAAKMDQPFGLQSNGLLPQIELVSQAMIDAYYVHLYHYSSLPDSERKFPPLMTRSGELVQVVPETNAGTYAIVAALALLHDADDIPAILDVDRENGFYQTYRRLFPDDPTSEANHIYLPGELDALAAPANLLQLPYPRGESWKFNGVHNAAGGSVGSAFTDASSLDFSPGWPAWNADTSNMWVVASAGGTPTKISNCNFKISHSDGWETVYYHLENIQGFSGSINQNDRIGVIANTLAEATCNGGSSTGPHVHFTLKRNGAYVALDGTPLSGWSVHSGRWQYDTDRNYMWLEKSGAKKYSGDWLLSEAPSSSGTGKGCDQVTYDGVELYEQANCNRDASGRTKSFSSATSWIDIVSDFNDIASSIYVKPGWSIKVYQNSVGEGGGSWRCITGSMWDLNSDSYTNGDTGRRINDDISSVQVYSNSSNCGTSSSGWAFQIFDLGDYNGEKYESNQSINDLSSVGRNDWAESMRINSGYEIIACEHANYGGVCGRATGPREFSDLNALAQGLRGQLTSVQVCAGSCPSGPSQPSSPNPSDGSTLSRTNNTTLYWSTNGDSCQVFVQGGSININPSGSCSNMFLGQQRGGAYSWYVKATNSYGTSQGPTWHFNIKPYGPSNLGASVVSANQINLSWSLSGDDNGTDIDGYDIYRSGQWLTSVNKGVSSYSATGLSCNTAYSFYVVSKRQGVQSEASNTVSATTSSCGPGTPSLNTPANNTVVGRYDSVTVSWNTASGATQYYAEFWGDSTLSINSGWTTSTSFFVGGTFWGGTYQWRVKSRNGSNVESGWSETRTLLRRYGSPTSFTATAASASQVNLAWSASADAPGNIEGYRIYRDGTVLATVGSSTTTYNDTGLSCNTGYSYYVKAYRGSLESDASTTANVTLTGCPPSMPGNLAVTGATAHSLTLTWSDTSNNETGFRIYRWKYDGTQWTFVLHASVGANVNTYTETGLACASDFNFYEVSAYNANGESPHAGWVKGTTSSCPPVPNDDFDSPKVITQSPYTDTMETTGATSAADDPPLTDCNIAPGIGTVWYRYVPPRAGQIDVDTIGSNYDTMLGVWTGTRGNLTLIGCNDDGHDLQSQLTVDVTGGVTYYIGAMQFSSALASGLEAQSSTKPTTPAPQFPAEGTALGNHDESHGSISPLSGGMLQLHLQFKEADLIVSTVSFSSTNPPANQPFNIIVDVRNQGRVVAQDFWVAIYVDRQSAGCGDTADWYGYVSSLDPGATQSITVRLVGDLLDGLPQGSHQIRAQADIDCTVYEDDENNNGYGPVSLNVAAPLTPPSNDDFNTPRTIAVNPYNETLDARGATRAQDDPVMEACGLNPGKGSVWYKFTPWQEGTLYVDTAGSDYDTVLAVWTGARGSLNPVACNDDIGQVNGAWDQDSRLDAPLAQGTTYYIEVTTFGAELSGASLQSPPAAALSDKNSSTGELSSLSGGALKLNFKFAPTVGAGLYDDPHLAWTYLGSWTAYTGTGPANSTLHYATTQGSEARLRFNGEKFTLTYVKASNRGLIDIYIDGTKIDQINAYSASLTWQTTWTSPILTPGVHTVRFVHAGGGTYMDIDTIQVFAPPLVAGIGTYDDADPAWVFVNSWTTYNGTGPAGSTDHFTNVVGAEAQISFDGTRFRLTYVKATNRGLIDVYVDGTKITTLNATAPALAWQQTWTSPTFSSGVHVARFVHAGGGTYADIDAIQILMPADTVPPAPVADLAATSGPATGTVTLHWTAPGDDTSSGTATSYLIRYSTSPISSEAAWNAATVVTSGVPAPLAFGTPQSMTVTGLNPGAMYYFAVRAQDEEPNLSGLSNPASVAAQGLLPLTAGTYDDTDINWTYSGTWTSYSGAGPANSTLHYANTVGSEARLSFNGSKFMLTYVRASNRGLIDVYVDGTKVSTINAKATTTAWQQTWTSPNYSSGVHLVRFVHAGGGTYIDVDAIQIFAPSDIVAPDAIGDLAAATGTTGGTVSLSWHAVGDDAGTGTAAGYLIRYSTTIINTAEAWNAATPVTTGLPAPAVAGTAQSTIVTGLVPGQTYFFAVRAQDEEGNLGGLSNSPSAAAESPTPVPVGAYDDTDGNWLYSGSWTSYTGAGPANNSWHTGTSGSEAQIAINGAKFMLTYVKASNRGLLDVYVDGSRIAQINASASTLTWQATWTSPSLTPGVHVVRLVHAGGTYIDIDAIQVFAAPSPVGTGTYDDNHAAWIFSSGWTTYSGSGPATNSSHYTNVTGSEAQLTFNGSGFVFTYVRASNRGSIDVYVDGSKVGTIDANNPTLIWQASWSSPVLTPGVHTVRFVHAGGGMYIDIDAITILP